MTDTTKGFTQLARSHQAEWRPLDEFGVSGIFVKTLRFLEFRLQAGLAPSPPEGGDPNIF